MEDQSEQGEMESYKYDVGYAVEAIHLPNGEGIVSFELSKEEGKELTNTVWRDVNFWGAPGGASVEIRDEITANMVSRILKDRQIAISEKHRWLFHVYLK